MYLSVAGGSGWLMLSQRSGLPLIVICPAWTWSGAEKTSLRPLQLPWSIMSVGRVGGPSIDWVTICTKVEFIVIDTRRATARLTAQLRTRADGEESPHGLRNSVRCAIEFLEDDAQGGFTAPVHFSCRGSMKSTFDPGYPLVQFSRAPNMGRRCSEWRRDLCHRRQAGLLANASVVNRRHPEQFRISVVNAMIWMSTVCERPPHQDNMLASSVVTRCPVTRWHLYSAMSHDPGYVRAQGYVQCNIAMLLWRTSFSWENVV